MDIQIVNKSVVIKFDDNADFENFKEQVLENESQNNYCNLQEVCEQLYGTFSPFCNGWHYCDDLSMLGHLSEMSAISPSYFYDEEGEPEKDKEDVFVFNSPFCPIGIMLERREITFNKAF